MLKTLLSFAGRYLNTLAHLLPRIAGRQGFRLFCRPFRTPLTAYHKKFLNTADQFSFEHDGILIQAYRWGEGPKKILFVHGWQSHSFRWKAYIESLSKEQYTMYAFDAPGHGLSGGSFLTVPYYSDIIQKLIDSLGEIHILVGHSLGCFASLHAIHAHPSLPVRKLILMAPPGKASDFLLFYQNTLKLSAKCVSLILKHFENVIQKPISYFSTTDFATSVKVSGLIIHDENDAETPYANAVEISQRWDNSKLITTKGLGHNLKSPEVVLDVINFIETTTNQPNMRIAESMEG